MAILHCEYMYAPVHKNTSLYDEDGCTNPNSDGKTRDCEADSDTYVRDT